jgi:membrane protease YdiL (CAAX protease family)
MNPALKSTLFQVGPFALALVFLSVAIAKGRINRNEIGLQPPQRGHPWRWVLGFLGYSLAVEAVVYWANGGRLMVTPWAYAWPLVLLRVVGILLLAPVVEELLLRGVLLAVLQRRHVPVLVAIVLQSLVFTLLHFGALSASWAGVLGVAQIFVDGLILGAARYRTGSLYPPMAMHLLGNALAVAERLSVF